MIVELRHPTAGKIKQVGIPIKLSDTPGQVKGVEPQLGRASEEVLLELGYTRDQIRDLGRAGAVQVLSKDS